MTEAADLREWAASVFDPTTIRVFSLLPDVDADEAYCVRHDRDMRSVDPILHTDGALYTTADGFSVYTCPRCVAALDAKGEGNEICCAGVKLYRHHLRAAFDRWDAGDAPADWFRYVGEGTVEDRDDGAQFITFGAGGDANR